MKNLIILNILVIGSIIQSFAANGDPVLSAKAATMINVQTQDDFIVIDYLRNEDLDLKRPIKIYNSRGKCIFKGFAFKREKVSEISMAQVKPGRYVIETTINHHTIQIAYEKAE